MANEFKTIQELLTIKADLHARLNLLSYDGTPEIKENSSGRYLYVRKRQGGKLTSTYVDVYSDDLYQMLLRNNRTARALRKQLRDIEKQLAQLGYSSGELSDKVVLNIEFARANMKANIYSQAVLEGVATTFPQTEDIIDNGIVNGVKASDVQKILNLKHAWEFILDSDVLLYNSNFYILSHIAKLVNEGFYTEGGRIRGVPVTIGGTSYVPPLPVEYEVKDEIDNILSMDASAIDKAVELCLYTMKRQIFNDGNKRAAVIYANHYLISQGQGFIAIAEELVPDFKAMLVAYYEDRDTLSIKTFIKEKCWKQL